MTEEFGLLRDFAIIMVVAGATTILFRLIHQPAILGYILAGVIVGPFTLGPTVQNVETTRQLADLGIVLVMFGLGLEFSLDQLRRVGLTALAVGTLKMLFMLVMGYEVGLLLGWSSRDALFLGAALSISSTMVIVKVLTELGRLRQEASRLMVSILVIEDFAAIAIIALFSSIATTGRADLAGAGVVVLKLGLFAISAIGLGLLLGPRLLELAHRAGREAVLVTGLALCFALALLSQRVGLSVAAGAFLMGTTIATTPRSEEMLELVTPLRDVFAALFFVAMGMLLDIRLLPLFLLPALLVFLFNLLGKVFSLSLGSFLFGYSVKTALRLGMGMVAVGEFSLIIVKVGLDAGVLGETVFPVVVTLTLLTTLASPHLMRLSEPVAEWLDKALPRPAQEYFAYGGLVERAFRRFLRRAEPLAQESRHHLTLIFLNVLIIAFFWGTAALLLHLGENWVALFPWGPHLLSLVAFLAVLVLSLPSLFLIRSHLRALVQRGTEGLVAGKSTARLLGEKAVGRVLQDATLAFILLGIALPALPLASRLYQEGSFLLFLLPLLAALAISYLFWDAIHHIHSHVQGAFQDTRLRQSQPPEDDPEAKSAQAPKGE